MVNSKLGQSRSLSKGDQAISSLFSLRVMPKRGQKWNASCQWGANTGGRWRREKHEQRDREREGEAWGEEERTEEIKKETQGGKNRGEGRGGRGEKGGVLAELSKPGGPGALITPCWATCE